MSDLNREKIQFAAKEGIGSCLGVSDPLNRAFCFLNDLRSQRGWSEWEIREVEQLVLQGVRVFVRQPRVGCCHDTYAK